MEQFDALAVVAQQRREAATNTEIQTRLGVIGIDAVHVVALLVRDHFQRQFIVIAEKQGPLAGLGDGRRLLQDIDYRNAVLHPHRHKHPRHQREMKRHVAFVALALPKVTNGVLRPLVRLG